VNQAGVRAARERACSVTMAHMATAIEVKYLGEHNGLALNPKERRRVVLHETGHAVITVLRNAGRLEKVTVLPRDRALGVTLSTHDEKSYLASKEDLLGRVDVLLAGRAIEELYLGSVTTGAEDDLKKATELVTAMFARFGFGRGLAALSAEQQQSKEFVQAVNELLGERYLAVRAELGQYRQAIDAIAVHLDAHDTIPGSVVEDELLAVA
jgi:cell division protease FtsH